MIKIKVALIYFRSTYTIIISVYISLNNLEVIMV